MCYIGAHDLPWERIREHELQDTIVAPVAVAAISPSVLKPDSRRSGCMRDASARGHLGPLHGEHKLRVAFRRICC